MPNINLHIPNGKHLRRGLSNSKSLKSGVIIKPQVPKSINFQQKDYVSEANNFFNKILNENPKDPSTSAVKEPVKPKVFSTNLNGYFVY
jgi:hypothetical protein